MSDRTERDIRIGRILNEFKDRRDGGEPVDVERLLADHPEFAAELREHLELLGEIGGSNGELSTLLAGGVLEPATDARFAAGLGPYGIVEFIGRGGMGIVLKAHDPALDRPVALKLLRAELAADAVAVRRFEREARAAARLRHPNVVTIHAVGEHRGAHYIAMEFIDGPTLAQVIRRAGPLPTETVRRVFRQLLDALACAHEAGLVHRDVKPANLLVDFGFRISDFGLDGAGREPAHSASDSDAATPSPPVPRSDFRLPTSDFTSFRNPHSALVKLSDFGLARVADSASRLTLPDSVFGTPEYMSPEQARGDADVDHRTDLYSAGAVLHEMLTGRPPFAGPSAAVVHRILHEDAADPRSVNPDADPALCRLALRLLAKRPEERYATAAEALRAMEGEAVGATLSPRARRITRRAAIGILAAAGLGYAFSRIARNGDPRPLRAEKREQSPPSEPPSRVIRKIKYDPDERHVLAYYDQDAVAEMFYDDREVNDAALVAADVPCGQLVVVGLHSAIDEKGSVLLGLRRHRKEVWRTSLHPNFRWPDTAEVRSSWPVTHVVSGCGLLVVVASDDKEYPTRISVIDPDTGTPRSTFWHFGDIEGVFIQGDFFEDGRPAIVAWGLNNKLDGFHGKLRDGETRLVEWDVVSVVMVLDPDNMNGVGPPVFDSTRMPDAPGPARPYAYAFLNLPYNDEQQHIDRTTGEATRRNLGYQDVGKITEVGPCDALLAEGDRPCFRIEIGSTSSPARASINVNRRLEIHDTNPKSPTETAPHEKVQYWKARWKSI